jgi:hypothetical protein
MKQYVYKCVPVPQTIDTGKKGKNAHAQAVSVYQDLINESAKDGWELNMIDEITSMQSPGCISGLFGSKEEIVTFKMLVFRKEV